MKTNEAVKNRILQLCADNKITINKLGIISGVTQSTLNNIVGTRNSGATISTIKKICDGLEISLSDFFNNTEFNDLEQELE